MPWDARQLPASVASILALDGGGFREIPLVAGTCRSKEAQERIHSSAHTLPPSVLAGLWVYFSAFPEAHEVAQDLNSAEGSYWHAILHRMEPDDWNSGYWFRRVGQHPIYPELAEAAAEFAGQHPLAEYRSGAGWDSFRFIEFCAEARDEPGGEREALAKKIQLAEWQLLFSWCLAQG